MSSEISAQQVKKNIGVSVLAQIISLVVSFIMNLILPKFISEYQYAYWQTYLLYIGYVGVLHFGLLDGIVLRYSQYDYEELDKTRIRSQFMLLLFISGLFSLVGIIIAGIFCSAETKIIYIFVSIGIITRNFFTYTSYTFQMTNRINKYAIMIISYRLFYGIAVGTLLFIGMRDFWWFCMADLGSDIFGIMIGAYFNRGLYFGISLPIIEALKEVKLNVTSGAMLMVANWSSFLLTGSARMIIQWHWDKLTFGKVSFSLSITNLLLTFVTAISVVLFPSLKRMDYTKLSGLYTSIRNAISPFLISILIFYYPGCWILNKWLPAYNQSLIYLGMLLPSIVFTSKVSLLTNNYLKAYREEKKMLMINIISVLLAISVFMVSAYIFNNLNMMLMCMVGVLAFRSILSEINVMAIIGLHGLKAILIEVVMCVIFIVSSVIGNLKIGCIIYIVALSLYTYIYRESLSVMAGSILKLIKKWGERK